MTNLELNLLAEQNVLKVLRDGPRLRSDYNTWIVARRQGRVLVGGLGSLGVGQMWLDEGPQHKGEIRNELRKLNVKRCPLAKNGKKR